MSIPTRLSRRLVRGFGALLIVGTLAIGGCAAASTTTSPSASPVARPVTTTGDAIARVVEREPRFTGVQPFDTGIIGQSSWYTAEPASGVGAFIVTVRVGWGDCEAGCIDEHRWILAVAPDGVVSLLSETGAAVPADAWPNPNAPGRTGITGLALAGPVCPVERVPPDPACSPRPVVGASVVIRDRNGAEVARTNTAADGSFTVELAPGDYVVEPQPKDGLLGTPSAQAVTVTDGEVATIRLEYDTGIR